jgi:hypothetical protein
MWEQSTFPAAPGGGYADFVYWVGLVAGLELARAGCGPERIAVVGGSQQLSLVALLRAVWPDPEPVLTLLRWTVTLLGGTVFYLRPEDRNGSMHRENHGMLVICAWPLSCAIITSATGSFTRTAEFIRLAVGA